MDKVDVAVAVKAAVELLRPYFAQVPVPCWIAGGAIRDLVLFGRITSDVDMFFRSHTDTELAKHAIRGMQRDSKGTTVILENDNVYKYDTPLGKIDVCRKNYTSSYAIVASFDFTVCSAAISSDGEFFCHPRFFEDLVARKLVINNCYLPIGTMLRMQKYIQKGYTACQGTMLQIAESIQKVDLSKTQILYID